MANKCLVIESPGAMVGSSGVKVENYIGIEFVRGASDGGGAHGYHKMIGDEQLLKDLSFFDVIKLALVKNGVTTAILNQTNIYKTNGGQTVDVSGADGSDIMQNFGEAGHPWYWINGGSDPTYERYIYSDTYFEYGNDKAEKYDPFGQAPDREVIVNGKARSIISNNPGSMVATKCSDVTDGLYANANGYPTSYQSRYNFEAAARAKNSDPSKNIPYCNGNTLDLEFIMGILYVECRTKILTSVFGHGISSNIFPNDDNWNNTSGFRTKVDGTYKYFNFTNNNIYVGKAQSGLWRQLTGGDSYSLLQVMQVQKEISNGATIETVYNSDGEPLKGLGSGVMTGIFKKTITFKLNCAFDSTSEDTEHTFEMHLCVPVWRGATWLYGQIWSNLSGYEVLNYKDSNGSVVNMLYRAPSIEAIMTDSDEVEKTAKGQFAFESVYDQICDLGNQGNWMMNTISKDGKSLCICNTPGGGITNYNQAYTWLDSTASDEGKFRRKTAGRSGGVAAYGHCVLRYFDASFAPSNTWTDVCSRFRVKLS